MTARIIMKLRVAAAVPITPEVLHLRLEHPLRPELPPWTAGAHVDMRLPDGRVRQYSLCGDPSDRSCYEIAVKLEAAGRGGSAWIHDNLAPGAIAHISHPRNSFTLEPGAKRYVLVAGGIGVTPFIAMARTLRAQNADFTFHLCARSAMQAPLLDALREICGERLHCWFSAESRRFEPELFGAPEPGTHVYACGPQSLVDCLQTKLDAKGWPAEQVHIERFAATLDENYKPEPFDAMIESTGQILHVPADRSLLEVLHDNGFMLHSSCEIGVCGSCECAYRDGTVIHRDSVLPLRKRQDRLMPCVSRARVSVTLAL